MEMKILTSPPVDEKKLVKEIIAGSEEAYEALVNLYKERLFKLMARFTKDPFDQEDLVQEVFLKVFKNIKNFKFDSALFTWIYRIAVNAASDYLSARKKKPLMLVENLQIFEKGPKTRKEASIPVKNLLSSEKREIAITVLSKIPEKFRKVLILREYEDLPYQEIAQILGISIGTVESRLFRARKRFLLEAEKLYPGFFTGG